MVVECVKFVSDFSQKHVITLGGKGGKRLEGVEEQREREEKTSLGSTALSACSAPLIALRVRRSTSLSLRSVWSSEYSRSGSLRSLVMESSSQSSVTTLHDLKPRLRAVLTVLCHDISQLSDHPNHPYSHPNPKSKHTKPISTPSFS